MTAAFQAVLFGLAVVAKPRLRGVKVSCQLELIDFSGKTVWKKRLSASNSRKVYGDLQVNALENLARPFSRIKFSPKIFQKLEASWRIKEEKK